MIKTKQDKFNKINTKAKIKRKNTVTQKLAQKLPLKSKLTHVVFIKQLSLNNGVPCIFEKTLAFIRVTLLHFSSPVIRNVFKIVQ